MITMASAEAKLERAFQSGLETYYRIKRGVHQVVRIKRVDVREGAGCDRRGAQVGIRPLCCK